MNRNTVLENSLAYKSLLTKIEVRYDEQRDIDGDNYGTAPTKSTVIFYSDIGTVASCWLTVVTGTYYTNPFN